jgi:hypothetical protein
MQRLMRCPYTDCSFMDFEDAVDEHRAYAHQDQPQAGSNMATQPPVGPNLNHPSSGSDA